MTLGDKLTRLGEWMNRRNGSKWQRNGRNGSMFPRPVQIKSTDSMRSLIELMEIGADRVTVKVGELEMDRDSFLALDEASRTTALLQAYGTVETPNGPAPNAKMTFLQINNRFGSSIEEAFPSNGYVFASIDLQYGPHGPGALQDIRQFEEEIDRRVRNLGRKERREYYPVFASRDDFQHNQWIDAKKIERRSGWISLGVSAVAAVIVAALQIVFHLY